MLAARIGYTTPSPPFLFASMHAQPRSAQATQFDVLIVGAGFAGMYMLHRLRKLGMRARVLDAASGVGGTWYWNRYPGARCDIESVQYSYQFSPELEQDWTWSERYATQPEILRYAEHVAERFDLKRDIQFDTRVASAHFDDAANSWTLTTERGEVLSARFCVMATGCLSAPNKPKIEGLDDFKGPTYHTAYWPHEGVDFTGQRVGVIGTGSSAIQSIPIIAQQAAHLFVFQRTPNFSVPARNQPLDPGYVREVKANYRALRARAKEAFAGIDFSPNPNCAVEVSEDERRREFARRWAYGGVSFMGSFSDLLFNRASNETAAAFVRERIAEIVRDPKVAEALSPHEIIGCKRLCVDTDYYATFNRPNVTLVDVRDKPIERITENGVQANGKHTEIDALVLATGFDAMTGALNRIDIRGAGGRSLKEQWKDGPRAYLGLMIAGFPNLFTVTGPGSPSVLTNMLPTIEHHVEWISDCLVAMRARNARRVEPTLDAQHAWNAHVSEVAGGNLRSACSSWYVGANIPGKPRVFMPYIGGFPVYLDKVREIVEHGYQGFEFA